MPFGVIARSGQGMRQVVRFGDRSMGRGTFGGEFGVRHCNQWELTFAGTWPSSQITLGRLVGVVLKTNFTLDHVFIGLRILPAGILHLKHWIVLTDSPAVLVVCK